MPALIGFTGFSGAGKTSAIEYVASRCEADRIYVGQLVADEVIARGLPPGPDSEKAVRVEMRSVHGMAGLAVLASSVVQQRLDLGRSVLIDAICSIEEMDYYRTKFEAEALLVSILARFDIRSDRVAIRSDRPIAREKLIERDELEVVVLKTDRAIQAAQVQIDNESNLPNLHTQLDKYICSLLQTRR